MESRNCRILIKKIYGELERQANSVLRENNLTLTQADVLVYLMSSDTHRLSLKDLEDRLHVAQSTATGIVMRLEEKGLVDSCSEGRHKVISLTDKGRICCESADRDMAENEARMSAALDPEERRELYRLLKKVGDAL